MAEDADEAPPDRLFTLDEANDMIPRLTEELGRVRTARQVVLQGGRPIRDSAIGNGGGEREYHSFRRHLRAWRYEPGVHDQSGRGLSRA